jgi:TRAP-type mannitol/chloroaromatic compound transport system permease large subunit
MLDATVVLLRWCPGALAVSVMVMGTILAAPIGVVGAAVITLSVIALPQMLARATTRGLPSAPSPRPERSASSFRRPSCWW